MKTQARLQEVAVLCERIEQASQNQRFVRDEANALRLQYIQETDVIAAGKILKKRSHMMDRVHSINQSIIELSQQFFISETQTQHATINTNKLFFGNPLEDMCLAGVR